MRYTVSPLRRSADVEPTEFVVVGPQGSPIVTLPSRFTALRTAAALNRAFVEEETCPS